MRSNELKVGGRYRAKVSGVLTTVRLLGVRKVDGFKRQETRFDVVNERTNKQLSFRSAARFLNEVGMEPPRPSKKLREAAEAAAESVVDQPEEPTMTDDPTRAGGSPTSTTAEGDDRADPTMVSSTPKADSPTAPITTQPRKTAGSPSVNALLAGRAAAVKDTSPHLIVIARAGCLASDTIINVNRAGKGFQESIENVVNQFNGVQPTFVREYLMRGKPVTSVQRMRPWDLSIPTYVARAVGGIVRLGRLKNAWCSGEKETFLVVTDTGRSVRATAIHPFLTEHDGWLRLEQLEPGQKVQVNVGRSTAGSARSRGIRAKYKTLATRFHPNQRSVTRYGTGKVAAHRLVVEADINGMTLEEFLWALRYDAEASSAFEYLSESKMVHHKNENTLDNSLRNLEVVDGHKEHSEFHSWGDNVLWRVGFETVVAVEPWNVEMTYDLEIEDDPHNFLANGFVVHNTGKTTTLVSALQRLKGIEPRAGNGAPMVPSPQQAAVWDAVCRSPRDSTVTFCAFNKSIAIELQRRVPAGCAASTMHSLGFRAVRSALGRLEPTEWAGVDLIAEQLGTNARDLRRDKPVLLKAADELVSLCKMNLTDPTPENLDRLASHYDVELDRFRRDVFDLVPRVLEAARNPKGRITYDDMLWLPIVLNLPVPQTDLMLVDEAQDLNRCQQALAKLAGRRLIFCGDPAQSIYGFAGADNESMERLEAELRDGGRSVTDAFARSANGDTRVNARYEPARGCERLSLTVTRRCGKAIVQEARRWVPDFEAHEGNPEGAISEARYPWRKDAEGRTDALPWAETYAARCAPGDMVLCRTNAPLVKNCFGFIRRGIKANIQGRDVGRGLASLVEKLAAGATLPAPALVGRLSDWLDAETAKEQAKRNPSEARLTALTDKHDCLLAFCDGAADSVAVLAKIGSVFTDDKASPGVRLSSIHRAKGLEAHRVFWLRPPEARLREDKMQPWELQQQRNLDYVATTRAANELIYVS